LQESREMRVRHGGRYSPADQKCSGASRTSVKQPRPTGRIASKSARARDDGFAHANPWVDALRDREMR